MQVKSTLQPVPHEAAALSLCVAAAMLAGCNPAAADASHTVEAYQNGAAAIEASQVRLSRLAWPRFLIESR
jgi:hypothetical protein